jgi:outer membrane protein
MLRAGFFIPLLATASLTLPLSAAAQQVQFGPATPGVCLLGREAAIGASKAGQAGTARMQQLVRDVAAELKPQQDAIIQENTALEAVRKTLPPAQFQPRAAALQQRAQAFNQLRQLRAAQIQRTKALVEQQIAQAIDPLMGPIIAARKCAVVFERAATYGWNPALDLTPAVVQALDQRMPTIQFNLATPQSVQGGQ